MTDVILEEGGSAYVVASGKKDIIFKARLTISKLAQALKEVEKHQSYAHALACVDLLDYRSVCELAKPDDPQNDPNLMPSRFMVLLGATDESLKAKGNLDNYPYPLGKGMPKECGCQALADFLLLDGALDGDSPKWWKGGDGRIFEECDQELTDGFCTFADGKGPIHPLEELPEEHVATEGETLGSVAEQYGIRSWTLLWELNKGTVSDPSAALKSGDKLKLPNEKLLDTSAFENWIDGFSGVAPAEEWGYFDPRTTMLDETGRFMYRFAEIADCHFLPGGFVPHLSPDADLAQVLATVIGYAESEADSGCLVLGHCDPADPADDVQKLSLLRAKAVQAILGKDKESWAGLVQDASASDVRATLSGLATVLGWDCDPKTGLDEAMRWFRSHCNDTYRSGLTETGDWTTADWKAVHRVLCGQVALRLMEADPHGPTMPDWPVPELESVGEDGVFACADAHPIPSDLKAIYTSRTHRRVELVFAPAILLEMGDDA